MSTAGIFWDIKLGKQKIVRILRNESDRQFIQIAALLLSRANTPKEVFKIYLDKKLFCRNWRRIKRQMRMNKWADNKIIFWQEVYGVLIKKIGKDVVQDTDMRILDVDPEIKMLADMVKAVRKKQGITQSDLGKKAKISQQTISFFEKGYVNLSLKTLKKIVDAVGLKVILVEKK